MAERVIRETVTRDSGDDVTPINQGVNTADKVIWFVAGLVLVLLAFRFLLALLGANTANGFANFIYTTSHPFVSPFFSLFSYNPTYGASKFELYTLVAILVYAVVAWIISALVNIGRR